MLVIIKRILRDKQWTIVIYCFAALVFLWMYVVLFPSIKDSFADLQKMLHAMPEGMLKAFGFDTQAFGTFEGYIGSEQFTLIWPIMIIALSSSFAGQALAGEVEKGTAEFLLSQPVSRLKLFFSKYFAGIVGITIFILVSVGSIFPLTSIYNISIKGGNFLTVGLIGFCFALAVYALTMFFSALFSEKGKANFVPVGILVLMYVVNIIAGLQASLENLKYLSFFYYFNPSKALIHNEVDALSWIVFLLVFVVFTTFAAIIFNKRDVAR